MNRLTNVIAEQRKQSEQESSRSEASSKEEIGDMEVDTSIVQPQTGRKYEANDKVNKKQRFAPMSLDNIFCDATFARYLHCRI